MITMEQVEKLREKTGITYEEAKKVLEQTDGDLLEALILLERENKVKPPSGGGTYNSNEETKQESSEKSQNEGSKKKAKAKQKEDSLSFGELVGSFFNWMGKAFNKGNANDFEVNKDGKNVIRLPLTVLVLLLIFTFWFVIPLMIIGLIFGFRYSFSGPDLEKTKVNKAMDTVTDVTMKAVDSVVDAAGSFSRDIKKGKGEEVNEKESDSDH
ncbi:MAG: DUF4342 domain-containing protein [Gudongella sp.]|nr:DUF4342 domain-containing protein [Gudongella sp.]